jgi:hypothetical protein
MKTSAGGRSVLRSARRRAVGARATSPTRGITAEALFALAPVAPVAVVPLVPSDALVTALQQLASSGARLALGYGIAAKRARDPLAADVGASLATLHRAVADELAAVLASFGMSVPRTKPTCSERLRWEWLASTGLLMNGRPERPVLDECARIERAAEDHVVMLRDEAEALGLTQLRQLVTLLQRARAASLRLEARALDPSSAVFVA